MQVTPPPLVKRDPGPMTDPTLEDLRSNRPVERLLEDSWETRERRISRRELLVESAASLVFLAIAFPLAVTTVGASHIDVPLAAALVVLYALSSCFVRFPIGAGYVVPSYMVLVPMLLLLPPGIVPLMTAGGLMLGTLGQVAARRVGIERVLFSIPDAWHALGPALVLLLAHPVHGGATQ